MFVPTRLLLVLVALLLPLGVWSQSTAPESNTLQATSAEHPATPESRTFLVIPGFHITDDHNAPPLTGRQKWNLWVKKQMDPYEFATLGLGAGIGQAENDPKEYGQGMAGFSKRYGASLANDVAGGFFSSYLFPTLLHEDTRYFRLGEGRKLYRVAYALSTNVVIRTDSGKHSYNWSRTLGSLCASALSNTYHPGSDRSAAATFQRAGLSVAMSSLSTIGDEFWPDIERLVFHRKAKNAVSASDSANPQP